MRRGYGNPYGAVPRALTNTQYALRDIMADQMAQRTESSKLRMAIAGIAAQKEVSKMTHDRALADVEFSNSQAVAEDEFRSERLGETSRHNKAVETAQGRQITIDEDREKRLGSEAAEARTPLTRQEAFDRLGIGPVQAEFLKQIVPADKKMPAQAWQNLADEMKDQPRVNGAWLISQLYDTAADISQQPPTPEGLKALGGIKKQIELIEIGISEGDLKPADVLKARETLMEQWEDVSADPESAIYQQILAAAGGDETAAADLFVEQGVKDLKKLSASSSYDDQAEQLRGTIGKFTTATTPRPPAGLAEKVTAHIDQLAMDKSPEAAGKFKEQAQALFEKNDFEGIAKLLPDTAVPDVMMAAHDGSRKAKPKGPKTDGGRGQAIAAEAPPALRDVSRRKNTPDYSRYKKPVVDKNGTVWAEVDGKTRRVPGGIRPPAQVRDGKGRFVPNPKYKVYQDLLKAMNLDKHL